MYNKIFTKILDSSIWLEDNATRIVWITLIAAMDEDGYAHFSAIRNLANRAQVSMEDAEKAVEVLLNPDPDSANPDHDGRRIERVPGGFYILNSKKHRDMVTRVVQREQTRERVKKHRAKKKGNATVTQGNEKLTPSEADTEAEAKIKTGDISSKSPRVVVPFQKIVDLYHEVLKELPRVEKLTGTRKGYIRQRWIEDLPDLKHWENYFHWVKESSFLMGKSKGNGDRPPFRANLEWITKPANYAKITEENYHRE